MMRVALLLVTTPPPQETLTGPKGKWSYKDENRLWRHNVAAPSLTSQHGGSLSLWCHNMAALSLMSQHGTWQLSPLMSQHSGSFSDVTTWRLFPLMSQHGGSLSDVTTWTISLSLSLVSQFSDLAQLRFINSLPYNVKLYSILVFHADLFSWVSCSTHHMPWLH